MEKEYKIGDIFINNKNELIQCLESNDKDDCLKCPFNPLECINFTCYADERKDRKNIYFKILFR